MASDLIQPGGERIPGSGLEVLEVGQWYWVQEDDGESLACVTHVGTNYAELTFVNGASMRIHDDEFAERCRYEPDPKGVIQGQVKRYRKQVRGLLSKIQDLTSRLGVDRKPLAIGGPDATQDTTALSVIQSRVAVEDYKAALIRAQDKELPKLFKQVKGANEALARWTAAEMIPLEAEAEQLQGVLGTIKGRLANVQLYAGLTEQVVQVRGGEPGSLDDVVHLMQRMCYMDEECVAGYRAGGISWESVADFDRWAAEPENFVRLFPFPKCLVAFRVRRNAKERSWDGTISNALVNLKLKEADRATFLCVRNGDRLYRLSTDLDFGPKLFPDLEEFDLSEPMWARTFAGSIRSEDLITDREYREILRRAEEKAALAEAWSRENPDEDEFWNPHRSYDYDRYEPFDATSVYYDDIAAEISRRIDDYNRISLIVQGLFDRSEVLHPHRPVKIWTPEGFAAAVKLVYDKDRTLHYGEPPDFEAYRARCNASLRVGSVTIGQEDFWERLEAQRENARRDRSWRYSQERYRPERLRPYGNPGPGEIARVQDWRPRAAKAVYRWTRERQRYDPYNDDRIPCTLTVPAGEILNLDAYQAGDFRPFYQDPRSRRRYLQWAPMLLAAEEYRAGNPAFQPQG